MNVCIFYYDGFCEFEVVIAAAEFSSQNLITVALESKIYISEEKQKFIPDKILEEIDPRTIDLFIIPGGNPSYLYDNSIFKEFINVLNENEKTIAAICGGTELLAAYGILDDRRCTGDSNGLKDDGDYIQLFKKSIIVNDDIVVDGNIITATGQAFIEFASQLGKIKGIYKNDDEAIKTYRWYKNIN